MLLAKSSIDIGADSIRAVKVWDITSWFTIIWIVISIALPAAVVWVMWPSPREEREKLEELVDERLERFGAEFIKSHEKWHGVRRRKRVRNRERGF